MSLDKETKKIEAILILEIIGKPAPYLVEMLEKLIKSMGEEKGVSVKNKKINEPILIKDQKDLYTTYAEIEVTTEGIMNLVILMFKYMPAHVEVISPEQIALKNNEWSDILSEITRRLHGYDEVARILQNERVILEKKLRELIQEKNKKEPEKTAKEKQKKSK